MYIFVGVHSGNTILAHSFATPSSIIWLYNDWAELNKVIICASNFCFTNGSRSSVEFWRFFASCLLRSGNSICPSSLLCAYLWENSWKVNDLCLNICAAIARVVSILQCHWWLLKHRPMIMLNTISQQSCIVWIILIVWIRNSGNRVPLSSLRQV